MGQSGQPTGDFCQLLCNSSRVRAILVTVRTVIATTPLHEENSLACPGRGRSRWICIPPRGMPLRLGTGRGRPELAAARWKVGRMLAAMRGGGNEHGNGAVLG